nr:uncharacterized protein LOC127303290 [Lolium perenne]
MARSTAVRQMAQAATLGNTAQWHWLKVLTKMETKWSCGSAALAFLYRQLDEACCRIGKDASIGGLLLLLSIWSWERFPVGRPRVLDYKNYDDHGNQLRRPTWAYHWDIVSEFSGDPVAAYQTYTNEFDNLTPEQVEWEPYGPRAEFGNASTFTLNPACMAEASLCIDRRRSKKTDWHKIHRKYVKKFVMRVEEQKKAKGIQYEEHSEDAFNQSASPSDQDDANNSNSSARDEEVSDEAEGEHEVDEDDEEVPLGKYVKNKWFAYKLKPRKERQDRYTPDAYAKALAARKARKKAIIESDEEEHMEPSQKIPSRRGGKTKRARN